MHNIGHLVWNGQDVSSSCAGPHLDNCRLCFAHLAGIWFGCQNPSCHRNKHWNQSPQLLEICRHHGRWMVARAIPAAQAAAKLRLGRRWSESAPGPPISSLHRSPAPDRLSTGTAAPSWRACRPLARPTRASRPPTAQLASPPYDKKLSNMMRVLNSVEMPGHSQTPRMLWVLRHVLSLLNLAGVR